MKQLLEVHGARGRTRRDKERGEQGGDGGMAGVASCGQFAAGYLALKAGV